MFLNNFFKAQYFGSTYFRGTEAPVRRDIGSNTIGRLVYDKEFELEEMLLANENALVIMLTT